MTAAQVESLRPSEVAEDLDLTPTKPPFTAQQTAAIFNVSVDAVYDGVTRGEIRALRLGRLIRVPRAEVARLLLVGASE